MAEKVEKISTIVHGPKVKTSMKFSYVLLNEINYVTWSGAAIVSCDEKSKLNYVNGKIKALSLDDSKYKDWFSTNQSVMSWILNSLEPDIITIFNFVETSKDL